MGLGMIFGWIFWLLVLVIAVYAVLWLVCRSGSSTQTSETPLAILKWRYAAGEVDQAQYEVMKSQLS